METRQECLERLLRLTVNLRKLQREYFRTRNRGALVAARKVEADVDKLVARLVSRQASMFPGEGPA
jgi:Fe2+ transport system protein B